jgi:CRP/FNR family transcriptional regulator, cyclic AMP receptor protein
MTDPSPHAMPPPDRPARDDGTAGWKSHPFLQGLNAGHLVTLAECAMLTEFTPGQVIFREGEMANRFYLVLEGHVTLEAEAPDRAPVAVDTVSSGDVLGWSWLFAPYCWNFTARAVEPVRAVFFYGTWLRERCAQDPALGYELMRRTAGVVIRRLQAARQQLVLRSTRRGAG